LEDAPAEKERAVKSSDDIPAHALTVRADQMDGATDGWDESADSEQFSADQPGGWRFESQRWLATLNPGRTQREYQKAVSYFFTTLAVPQEISALTFDLLLAYRGALALRATAHAETQPRRPARSVPRSALHRAAPAQLESPAETVAGLPEESSWEAHDEDAQHSGIQEPAAPPGPLSPATVNVRLTALRQFLVYCALFGSATTLTPDQIRAALRRLSVERRRPYQTLAEPEWEKFLAAARLPVKRQAEAGAIAHETVIAQSARPHGPWGVPRAVREEAQAAHLQRTMGDESARTEALVRSRAGLTGERTGRRDYALLALALATGLRAIELASLDVGDLSREWRAGEEEWWLILPDSKTKGQSGGRTLPLAPELVEILRDYLEVTGRHWERPEDRETPLFLAGPVKNIQAPVRRTLSQQTADAHNTLPRPVTRRLSPSQIRLIVDRVETQWQARYAGADGKRGRRSGDARRISPHALRHSTAIALLEGNQSTGRPPASVEHVRGWLGHLDIRTTQGYLAHLDARRQRRPFTLSPVASSSGNTRDDTEQPEQ
jgi:integrase